MLSNYLLYQAYGNADVLNEALLSILSYLRRPVPAVTVLVYTDQEAHFRAVLGATPRVEYVVIAPAQWQAWRGSIDFVHRVKIEVLRHAVTRRAGNLLYVDTDTVFRQSPAEIFAALARGERFMHVAEGRLGDGNPLNYKIYQALRHTPLAATVGLGPATRMYNAGVLGLTSADAPLLDEVLTLTEQLFRRYPKHVMEQLAFSLVWARAGGGRPVREALPWVYHYWDLKEIRPVLARLFRPGAAPDLAAWQARAARLDVPTLAEGKAAFRRLPGWRRAWQRWRGQAWQLAAPEW